MKNSSFPLIFALLIWGVVAAVAGGLGWLSRVSPPGPQLAIVLLTVGFSVAVAAVPSLRDAAAAVSVRTVLGVHLTRFIGIYFLWLYGQGRLPVEFAQRAGWGDIVAATGALVLLFWPEGTGFRRALIGWNILAAADLLVAVGTAGWLIMVRPGSMAELTRLPLALVPLWLVPVLLSSHIYLLRRQFAAMRARRPAEAAA